MDNLTPQHYATLKAAINAEIDPAFVAARQALNWTVMAAFYNGASTAICWKTSLSKTEMRAAYNWTEILALTPAQSTAFALMRDEGYLNPADPTTRSGMVAILSTSPTTLAALTALAKRAMTKGERVFTAGTATNGNPATLQAEGAITERDLTLAMNS